MAIWLVRAGSKGEFEQKFIEEKRVYVTWDRLDVDLMQLKQKEQIAAALTDRFPDQKPKAIKNWSSQIWPFAHAMQIGDWVIVPRKDQTVYVGEITGAYMFAPEGPDPYFHWRSVKWIGESIPRTHFGQDIRFSLGAFMTICRIQRNNAEARLKAMYASQWQPEKTADVLKAGAKHGGTASMASDEDVAEESSTDLEEAGLDQIAGLINTKFKGHNLTRLVQAILQAKGLTTWQSPEGADGGADILASSGAMGFGGQRICVEVKSEETAIGREPLDKLLGAMSKFNASEGLFVAWGGFKPHVHKEMASSFFRLRLWDRATLLENLFAHYDQLSDSMKAELPLKRIWTVALPEEEAD